MVYNVHDASGRVKMYSVLPMAYPTKTDRESILAEALRQVEAHGEENLAIRSVAAALGLAPNALYRYFGSLSELVDALGEEARLGMLESLRKAAGRKPPADAIRAISAAYLRFAAERPRIFALYLRISPVEGSGPPQCERSTTFFLEQVARVYGEKRAWEASHALWALLHGMAVLRDAGVLSRTQLESGFRFGLRLWIEGAAHPSD